MEGAQLCNLRFLTTSNKTLASPSVSCQGGCAGHLWVEGHLWDPKAQAFSWICKFLTFWRCTLLLSWDVFNFTMESESSLGNPGKHVDGPHTVDTYEKLEGTSSSVTYLISSKDSCNSPRAYPKGKSS